LFRDGKTHQLEVVKRAVLLQGVSGDVPQDKYIDYRKIDFFVTILHHLKLILLQTFFHQTKTFLFLLSYFILRKAKRMQVGSVSLRAGNRENLRANSSWLV